MGETFIWGTFIGGILIPKLNGGTLIPELIEGTLIGETQLPLKKLPLKELSIDKSHWRNSHIRTRWRNSTLIRETPFKKTLIGETQLSLEELSLKKLFLKVESMALSSSPSFSSWGLNYFPWPWHWTQTRCLRPKFFELLGFFRLIKFRFIKNPKDFVHPKRKSTILNKIAQNKLFQPLKISH